MSRRRLTPRVQLRLFWTVVAGASIFVAYRLFDSYREEIQLESYIPFVEPPDPDIGTQKQRNQDEATDPDTFDACAVATNIHSEMKGLTFTSNFVDILYELTDNELAHVNNCFNSRYFKDNEATMRNWVNDEWIINPFVRAKRNRLNERFDQIGIY